MKLRAVFFFFLVAMSLGGGLSRGELVEYEKGEKLKVNPGALHPTQFLYSRLEVESKFKALQKLMTEEGEEAVIDFLKEHRGQVVVGPKNQMWLVDGHHHARALEMLKKSDSRFKGISFYARVLHEWNELTSKEFEKAMKLGNKHGDEDSAPLVYLKDQNGRIKSFSQLPRKLSSMKDWPYRSLVWLLKEEGFIDEVESVPFQEFIVAEYLKDHIKLPSKMTQAAYRKALKEAIDVIQDADEDSFPGRKKITSSRCGKILKNLNPIEL